MNADLIARLESEVEAAANGVKAAQDAKRREPSAPGADERLNAAAALLEQRRARLTKWRDRGGR